MGLSLAGALLLALVFSFFLTRGIAYSITRLSSENEEFALDFSCLPHCSFCDQRLPVSFSLPLFASFLQQKPCPSCLKPSPNQEIKKHSLVVELTALSGTLFLWYSHHWTAALWIDLLFLYTLILLAVVDAKTLFIESRLLILTVSLRILWLIVIEPDFLISGIQGMLLGAGALYWVGFIYETVRQRMGLGEGDAAVLGFIGLWVGWQGLGAVLLIAALSGVVLGGISLLRQGNSLWDTQLPFAPFLCGSGFIVYASLYL